MTVRFSVFICLWLTSIVYTNGQGNYYRNPVNGAGIVNTNGNVAAPAVNSNGNISPYAYRPGSAVVNPVPAPGVVPPVGSPGASPYALNRVNPGPAVGTGNGNVNASPYALIPNGGGNIPVPGPAPVVPPPEVQNAIITYCTQVAGLDPANNPEQQTQCQNEVNRVCGDLGDFATLGQCLNDKITNAGPAPAPVVPAPAPVVPAPVVPAPVDPAPVAPAPVVPAPVSIIIP